MFNVSCVQSVVGFNGEPCPITQAQIDALEQVAHNRQLPNPHRYVRTANEFQEGDEVMIVEGPFAGRLVTVDQISGRKAKIWLNLFGTHQDVEIGIDALEVA